MTAPSALSITSFSKLILAGSVMMHLQQVSSKSGRVPPCHVGCIPIALDGTGERQADTGITACEKRSTPGIRHTRNRCHILVGSITTL